MEFRNPWLNKLAVSALMSVIGWYGSTLYNDIRDTSRVLLATQERLTNAIMHWKEAENRNVDAIRKLHSTNGELTGRVRSIELYLEVTRGQEYRQWQQQLKKKPFPEKTIHNK